MRKWRSRSRGVRVGIAALALASGSGTWLLALPARAEGTFGARGQLALTAEDLVGYHARHRKYEDWQGQERETNGQGLALALQHGGARLGFHYFVLPQFSLGGTVGYDLRTGSNTMEDGDGTYTTDLGAEHTLLVGLRAGYALMFTDVVGFWFRGGPGVENELRRPNPWSDEDRDVDTTWLVSADVLFVVFPVPHFGLYLGPSGDLAFVGQHKQVREDPTAPEPGEWEEKESYQRFGAGLGLIGYF